jgi:hypothetical protein
VKKGLGKVVPMGKSPPRKGQPAKQARAFTIGKQKKFNYETDRVTDTRCLFGACWVQAERKHGYDHPSGEYEHQQVVVKPLGPAIGTTRVTLEPAIDMRVVSLHLIVMAGLLFCGCGKQDSTSQSTNASSSGNPLTAPVDYLGAAAKAKKATEKTVSSAGLNQAIQMFQAQEGRNPKTLAELVSKQYLSSIPPAPAGMRYDYNPQTGQVRVIPQ